MNLVPFFRMNHVNDIDQPEMIPLLNDIRAVADSYGETYVVGETFVGEAETAAGYAGTISCTRLSTSNTCTAPGGRARFTIPSCAGRSCCPTRVWPNYVLNNHDIPRSATRYARGEEDDRLKVAAAMLLTMRGTPFLYYGEEIGMRDIKLARDLIKDPVGQRYWPFHKGRDGCRAPMQWSAAPNAGFSPLGVETWLPVHPNFKTRNVMNQQADPNSLLNWYKRLVEVRKSFTRRCVQGAFLPVTDGTNFILSYLRQTDEETLLVALNFSSRRQQLVLGRALAGRKWKLLLSNKRTSMIPVEGALIPLEPNEALILVI